MCHTSDRSRGDVAYFSSAEVRLVCLVAYHEAAKESLRFVPAASQPEIKQTRTCSGRPKRIFHSVTESQRMT
jgi:hypothetical protein